MPAKSRASGSSSDAAPQAGLRALLESLQDPYSFTAEACEPHGAFRRAGVQFWPPSVRTRGLHPVASAGW